MTQYILYNEAFHFHLFPLLSFLFFPPRINWQDFSFNIEHVFLLSPCLCAPGPRVKKCEKGRLEERKKTAQDSDERVKVRDSGWKVCPLEDGVQRKKAGNVA